MKKLVFLSLILSFCSSIAGYSQKTNVSEAQKANKSIFADTNLLLYYSFQGNYVDSSGNGFHGSPHGTPLFFNRCGLEDVAVSFNGEEDYIVLPDTSKLKPQFPISVTCWVKINEFPQEYNEGIFCNDFVNDFYTGIWIGSLRSERIGMGYGNGGYIGTYSRFGKVTNQTFETNQWIHIVAIFKAQYELEFYINGVIDEGEYSGQNDSPNIGYSESPGKIGVKDFDHAPGYFNGDIDEVTYWSKALTPAEVDSIYNATHHKVTADFFTIRDSMRVEFKNLYSNNVLNYYWDFGNGFFSNLENAVYSYEELGVYEACLTVSNECWVDTKCDSIIDLNIQDNLETEQISIYPNPCERYINIHLGTLIDYHVQILSLNGKVMQIRSGRGDNIRIDMQNLSAGTYIVILKTESFVKQIKVVKN